MGTSSQQCEALNVLVWKYFHYFNLYTVLCRDAFTLLIHDPCLPFFKLLARTHLCTLTDFRGNGEVAVFNVSRPTPHSFVPLGQLCLAYL